MLQNIETFIIMQLNYDVYKIAVGFCNNFKGTFDGSPFETTFHWISFIIAIIPMACIPIGLLPVLNILTGELFPTEIRSLSVGVVKALTYVAAYANMTVYPIASGAGVFKVGVLSTNWLAS